MNRFLLISFMCLCCTILTAQTLTKEALFNFARYTHKAELSSLEKARKNIDDAYKSKKDSLNYKVNLIRGMVYSSLAYADSTQKLKYIKDPIAEALFALDKLKDPKKNYIHEPEIKFIKKQLANAWLMRANRALKKQTFKEAYTSYLSADSMSADYTAKHNLAILSKKLGYLDKSISYYKFLIAERKRSIPDYYLELSNLYEQSGNSKQSLAVIEEGRKIFLNNKELRFQQINIYADNGVYNMVISLADEALKSDPNNTNLIYLIAFSYEMIGKTDKAEEYYKRIISADQNNYDGNYALGLLYLNSFLKSKNEELVTNSTKYLEQASSINPNSVNTLKSLTILYQTTNNIIELERVTNKLSQIILN